MAALDRLAALGGEWVATYELRGDPSFDADSPSTATVSPILAGLFVQIDYTWSESGEPQEGLLLVGHDPATGAVTVVWLDTWHNGRRMMVCSGRALPGGGVDVFGTYQGGPDAPDWGWRTELQPGDDSWTMTMFNVSPDGVEAKAVSAAYRRRAEAATAT